MFIGFSMISGNTFVCCVLACNSPVAVRLQYIIALEGVFYELRL